jgi:hypothetical protein
MEHLSRRTTRDVQHLFIVTDPTQRGIPALERQRRSSILLGGALLAADHCPAIAADTAARPVLDSARSELAPE